MSHDSYTPQAVILANGNYPTHPLPLQLLAETPVVLCCDGAANEYIDRGHVPHLIVGDGDSLRPDYAARFAPLLHRVAEQETNDQTKAVRYLHAQGYRQIAIVGATGKREDHTLGNISLLIEYMRMGMEVRMFTDHGIFLPASGTRRFATEPRQQVSLFSFGTQGLRAEGLAYPLRDFESWWQGTLNQATAHELTIYCTGQYLLYLAFCHKTATSAL